MIRLPLLSHACPGQCEDKLRPNLLCADHINSFPVILDDLFYNGQPQTGSLFIFSTGLVSLIKPFPYFFQTLLRNPNPCIFDRHKDFLIL